MVDAVNPVAEISKVAGPAFSATPPFSAAIEMNGSASSSFTEMAFVFAGAAATL